MQKPKATIFNVAALAGVSIKTVSRVVNNEPNVSDKTRDKVLKAIGSLNYQPSAAARILSGKKSYGIGLVYENPHEFSYVGGVLNGALKACEDEGFTLLLRPLTLPDPNIAETVTQFVLQTRVDGLLLPAPLSDMKDVLDVLREQSVPFALMAPTTPVEDAINILCAEEEASFQLTLHLLELGHRRLGFIKGHPDHGDSEKRFSGYCRALEASGIALDQSFVRQGYFDFESGRRAAAELLQFEIRPTVIIASNDDMAAGALFEVREQGLSVPSDMSLVGFDDTPLASHLWPPMTTVRQPIVEMADAAVRALIRTIRGEELTNRTTDFNCEVILRQSTAPPLDSGI